MENVGGLNRDHRAVADHQLTLQVVIVAERVGVEAHLGAVDRADDVSSGVGAEGSVGRRGTAVAVGDHGDGAAEDEILPGGGEIRPGVVGGGTQGAVVEVIIPGAEDIVVSVTETADLAALEGEDR